MICCPVHNPCKGTKCVVTVSVYQIIYYLNSASRCGFKQKSYLMILGFAKKLWCAFCYYFLISCYYELSSAQCFKNVWVFNTFIPQKTDYNFDIGVVDYLFKVRGYWKIESSLF